MQTLPGFNIMYESSVVIPSTLLAQQSKVKMTEMILRVYRDITIVLIATENFM